MNDPYEQFLRRERLRYEKEKMMPKCDDCGEPIAGDIYYEIGGVRYCPECLEGYRRYTDDYYTEEE